MAVKFAAVGRQRVEVLKYDPRQLLGLQLQQQFRVGKNVD